MQDHLCEYKGCSRFAKYELFWESYDQDDNPVEPDTNNFALSCSSHLVDIVNTHEFGPPVDHVVLLKKMTFLPKLTD